MKPRFATEEDWVWFENLPDQLQKRITRLLDINNAFSTAYKKGYQKGYATAMRKLKKLVIVQEHGHG